MFLPPARVRPVSARCGHVVLGAPVPSTGWRYPVVGVHVRGRLEQRRGLLFALRCAWVWHALDRPRAPQHSAAWQLGPGLCRGPFLWPPAGLKLPGTSARGQGPLASRNGLAGLLPRPPVVCRTTCCTFAVVLEGWFQPRRRFNRGVGVVHRGAAPDRNHADCRAMHFGLIPSFFLAARAYAGGKPRHF